MYTNTLKKLPLLLLAPLLLVCGSNESSDNQSPANTNYLLILNKSADTAWQINAQSGQKVAEYSTGEAPHEVAVSPDQNRAVITNYGNDSPGNTLTVVDLENQKVLKTLSLGDFSRPHGIKWFSDGTRAIVTAEDQQAAIVVNIDNGEILSSIPTDQDVSHMVALGSQETTAYVTNLGSGSVSILDLKENATSQTIQTGAGTEGIAIIPTKNEAWITNRSANTISILDLQNHILTDTLTSSDFPIRAEASPNNRWVAISNAQSSEITIFDVESRQMIQEIATVPDDQEGMPIGLTFSNDGSRLFSANSGVDKITVISTDTWGIIDLFVTGATPDGIAYFNTANQ